jgi:hypothetical protein
MNTHVFHDDTQTFEPTSTKCKWCKGQIESTYTNCYVPLFKVTDRYDIVVYSSVNYKKLFIGIPRCKNCKNYHENEMLITIVVMIISVLISLVLSLSYLGIKSAFLFVSAVIIFNLITIIIYKYIIYKYEQKKNLISRSDIVCKDDLIISFKEQGWTSNQPKA